MDRRRFLPTYHYEDNTNGVLLKSVGKPLRDYRISGESVQDGTPTPENPSEIYSVGDKTGNLLDYTTFTSRNQSIYPLTIKSNGRLEYSGDYYIKADCSFLEGGKSYVFDAEYNVDGQPSTSAYWRIYYADGSMSGTAFVGKSLMVDASKKASALYVYGKSGSGAYKLEVWNIQLEEGTEAAAYEPYGYKIAVKVNETTHNIYLDEPLRKIGEYTDYVDFKNGCVVRNTALMYLDIDTPPTIYGLSEPVIERAELPIVPTAKGTVNITVDTDIEPSGVVWQYYKS